MRTGVSGRRETARKRRNHAVWSQGGGVETFRPCQAPTHDAPHDHPIDKTKNRRKIMPRGKRRQGRLDFLGIGSKRRKIGLAGTKAGDGTQAMHDPPSIGRTSPRVRCRPAVWLRGPFNPPTALNLRPACVFPTLSQAVPEYGTASHSYAFPGAKYGPGARRTRQIDWASIASMRSDWWFGRRGTNRP